jgi:hypothetical protein
VECVGGLSLRRRLMRPQLRGPEKKPTATESALQRNRSLAFLTTASIRISSAQRGEEYACS